jgi:hypothetical protein
MDWSSTISTLTGAIVGVGSTLLADRTRWRRDAGSKLRETRREVYTEFLSAMNRTSEALYAVALDVEGRGPSYEAAAYEAFRKHDVYAARERLILTGVEPVVISGDVAFHCLRDIRDAVAEGVIAGSAEHSRALGRYGDSLRELRNAMRTDLGAAALTRELSG